MNQKFIEEIIDTFEFKFGFNVDILNQKEIKENLKTYQEEFPMICFEDTRDSNFFVNINESKFLNDETHNGTWLMVSDQEIKCVICLKEINENNDIEIDTFEINYYDRGQGLGKSIVEVMEEVILNYYNRILVVPFDSYAEEFWEHMGYENKEDNYYIKENIFRPFTNFIR